MSDLKNRTRIGITLDNALQVRFKQLSKDTKIPMSKLFDEAVSDLLKKYEEAQK